MNRQVVTIIIVLAILYFWKKGKDEIPNLKNDIVIPPKQPSAQEQPSGQTAPDNISTIQSSGPVMNIIPNTGGLTYITQPITIPAGQSPYYWDEMTWLHLFNSNLFTNPETALAIYRKRDPNSPEYT
jgi:hypothetical protein